MSSSDKIAIHIVDGDDDPRAVCNGEKFDISEVSGSGVLELCEDCQYVVLSEEKMKENDVQDHGNRR